MIRTAIFSRNVFLSIFAFRNMLSAHMISAPYIFSDMPKRLPPQFASPAASPGVLLWQAVNRWQRGQRRALRDAGLSHLQVMLLASITSLAEQDEPVTQVMLARHARTDAMTTSQIVRTLEKKKLVRRADHPSDSRAFALRPTAAGRRLARQLIHLVERADQEFFASLGSDTPRFASMVRQLANPDEG